MQTSFAGIRSYPRSALHIAKMFGLAGCIRDARMKRNFSEQMDDLRPATPLLLIHLFKFLFSILLSSRVNHRDIRARFDLPMRL